MPLPPSTTTTLPPAPTNTRFVVRSTVMPPPAAGSVIAPRIDAAPRVGAPAFAVAAGPPRSTIWRLPPLTAYARFMFGRITTPPGGAAAPAIGVPATTALAAVPYGLAPDVAISVSPPVPEIARRLSARKYDVSARSVQVPSSKRTRTLTFGACPAATIVGAEPVTVVTLATVPGTTSKSDVPPRKGVPTVTENSTWTVSPTRLLKSLLPAVARNVNGVWPS